MNHAPRFCARPGAHPDMFLALSGVSIPQQKSASANKTGKCEWFGDLKARYILSVSSEMHTNQRNLEKY